ncbi:trimeric intracellular cation channel family protein [Qipengyuania sediminis]|uniref:trimeric intracellular cation channel family protein n=1 Tax=Qipengyuania sediminis TaxID=1532023 RepID=UPI001F10FB27|nr:trimeric intracellular cation channel family protein [Qipengyuania sediminis]
MTALAPAPLLALLDLAGVAVFALTGALAAARARQTFVTMAFFALLTGVGGGSVRDLLIGAPVFWMSDSRAAALCLGVAVVVWVTPIRWWQGALLDYADALGLAGYAVLGAAKALAWGVPPVPAFVMGVVTGCVGGIVRDVIAGEPSIIMRPELYVTAAALAAALCVAGSGAGLPRETVWVGAALAGFALRAAAIRWRLALPAYDARRQSSGASPGSGPPG